MENDASPQIAVRVSSELYEKIVKRQQIATKMTGIEPTISAVVRTMLEESMVRWERRNK